MVREAALLQLLRGALGDAGRTPPAMAGEGKGDGDRETGRHQLAEGGGSGPDIVMVWTTCRGDHLSGGCTDTKGRQQLWGVGLVEVMWKTVVVILKRRLEAAITLHDVLHRFRSSRRTGTSSLDTNLLQKLMAVRVEVLYAIFLGLHNAHGALEGDRCLGILGGYGVVLQTCRLLHTYWVCLPMMSRSGGYYGYTFKGYLGVTHGGPLSPTIFNVVVDAVG